MVRHFTHNRYIMILFPIFLALVLIMAIVVAANASSVSVAGADFQLFAGTSLNSAGTNHDAYEIDVTTNISNSIFSKPVWGATFDSGNNRVLFTSDNEGVTGTVGGSTLWSWSPGITPTLVGTITMATTSFRIDGLAISNGTLYGSRAAGNENGIYEIDMNTLSATLVFTFTDSISGIDADPNTGAIYGVNDSTAHLVEIDIAGGSVTTVTTYPGGGENDLDGLAISADGRAYLIPDDPTPGLIYVYNLNTDMYEAPLNAPWTSSDTFSGGAFIFGPPSLNVSKTASIENPTLGQAFTYTILISNSGTGPATGAVISDTLPSGINLAGPITIDPPGAGSVGTPPMLASGVVITSGSAVTITVPVTMGLGLPGFQTITNVVSVTSTQVVTPTTDFVTIYIQPTSFLPLVTK